MVLINVFAQIEWNRVLFGDGDWLFLAETGFRTLIMFLILLTALTLLGKRGVSQLSVFELVVIIGLGSAAGDPMFYKDVGVLPSLVVFIIVVSCYIFVTYMVGKSARFEKLIEGRAVYLVDEGSFAIENFKKETLAQDEFFAELRLKGVSQLGQVRLAIIEINGDISIFFYTDDEVKYGLPILPHLFINKISTIDTSGHYSCSNCGYTKLLEPIKTSECPECKNDQWVVARKDIRIK